eukprot:TRINITY_DN13434_c0_g1_i1.p1 TRINITY_DN13434_c0_g1~~TRINITY_DN13434_c0_g1_i1.p1  ORF type:complete len:249 (+),score=51.12 TRINITY_DN13434_c0_g1_i1:133-879(+)
MVTRPLLFGIITAFLPPLFIMIIIFGTYSLPTSMINSRLSIIGSGIVGLVMFHSTKPSSQYGELSFIDSFFLAVYLFIVATFFSNIVVLKLIRENQSDSMKTLGQAIDGVAEIALVSVFPFVLCCFWFPWISPLVLVVTGGFYVAFRVVLFPKLRSLVAASQEKSLDGGLEADGTGNEEGIYKEPGCLIRSDGMYAEEHEGIQCEDEDKRIWSLPESADATNTRESGWKGALYPVERESSMTNVLMQK